jgi:mono/diheme cytochrome c family protein
MSSIARRAHIARFAGLALVAGALAPGASAVDPGAQAPPPQQPAAGSRAARPSGPAPSAASNATALQVYRRVCLDCHDNDGKGEIGRDLYPKLPDFTDAGWQDARSDAVLARSVLDGKGKMPAMKTKLGAADVKQMVAFVRAFRGGKQVVEDAPEAAPAPAPSADARPQPAAPSSPAHREGGPLFRKLCAACHGADGRGSVARDNFPTLPDFTLRAWHEKRGDSQLLVSVLEGKGTGMPPFRGKIGREQARGLIAFVRSFSPSGSRPASAAAPHDFEARFRKLQDEMEALQRQYRALPTPCS